MPNPLNYVFKLFPYKTVLKTKIRSRSNALSTYFCTTTHLDLYTFFLSSFSIKIITKTFALTQTEKHIYF